MKHLFVMDPFERVHPQKDTTYLLIREALRRGHEVYVCDQSDLSFSKGEVFSPLQQIDQLGAHSSDSSKVRVSLQPRHWRAVGEMDVVWMRTDPPYSLDYLTTTYLLHLAESKTRVINRPDALQGCNEKIFALHFFEQLCPESLLSSSNQIINSFMEEVGGKAIAKPLYGAGGEGVFVLNHSDSNLNVILESMTDHGRRVILVQRFLPEVSQGDKRIIIVDGEPLGATLRISQSQDHRSNIHVGGECFLSPLTDRDREICSVLKPTLLQKGLFLVGIDVIGDYLSEINVTSPTGFQEINRLEGRTGAQTIEAMTFDRL